MDLEVLVGKCNVVYTSKDERNPQPSAREVKRAHYIFSRTFDVGKFRISDKIGDRIAGTEITDIFNKKRSQQLADAPKHPSNLIKSSSAIQPPPHSSSPNERKALELPKDGGKQHVIKEGASSSTPTEDKNKRNSTNQQLEGLLEGSAIRPGIAPGLKFGGSGSYPDLTWVSTTCTGPNGRTISGVTYRFDKNQVRIVCACHGSHMSPEEFLQHASADQQTQEDNTIISAPLSSLLLRSSSSAHIQIQSHSATPKNLTGL
ncbi:Ninja-like protein, partial [Thalictrum thalictroides]